MGKLFKSGQYAKRFKNLAEAKSDGQGSFCSQEPWREAAMSQIKELLAARGGIDKKHLTVKDSRSTWKMIKQFEVLPIQSKDEKKQDLYDLYVMINKGKLASEIHKQAAWVASQNTSAETKKLAKAIAEFTDPNADYALDNQRYKPKVAEQSAIVSAKSVEQQQNPFELALPETKKTTSTVARAHAFVPQYDEKGMKRTMPWMVAGSPYYSAERAERHVVAQNAEAVLYTLGATVINSSPELFERYQSIAADPSRPPNRHELRTQAFFVMAVGLRTLPEEMANKGFEEMGKMTRFMTMGTQGQVFPNGGHLNDAHALHDLQCLFRGIPTQQLRLSKGFCPPKDSEVPTLDFSSGQNLALVSTLFGASPELQAPDDLKEDRGGDDYAM